MSRRTAFGLMATKQLRNRFLPATAKAFSNHQYNKYINVEPLSYLVIASHELRYGMQNGFTTELLRCGSLLEYIVNFYLLLSLQLCFLCFQYLSGDGMVILRYAIFLTTFFVYSIMTTYVSSTCGISASIESGSLSALQILFFSIHP